MSLPSQKKNQKIMSDMVPARVRTPRAPESLPEIPPQVMTPLPEKTPSQSLPRRETVSRTNVSRPAARGCALPFITICCMVLLVFFIGGLFARTSIVVTPQSISQPLDVSLNLTQGSYSDTISFETVTQTFSEKVPVDASATTEGIATLSTQLHDRIQANDSYLAMKQKISQDVPQKFLILPLAFYDQEPTITLEKYPDGSIQLVGGKKCTLLLVDRTLFAKKIKERLKLQDTVTYTITHDEELTFTTQVLATPDTLPATIPVRITGKASLEGDIDLSLIRSKVLGMHKKEALAWLATVSEIKTSRITMIPFWRSIIPRDSSRVFVVEK